MTKSSLADLFYFIHIPKCAGTTFIDILRRNFGVNFGDGRTFLSDRNFKYTEQQLLEIAEQFPNIRCFFDHKLSLNIPQIENVKSHVVTFVRDPAERLISHYFYCRAQTRTNFDPLTKQLGLEDYVNAVLFENPVQDIQDGQTYHLSGDNSKSAIPLLEDLKRENRLDIFPVENFNEACILLEKTKPDIFKDCTYVLKNKTKRNEMVSEKLKNKIGEGMPNDKALYLWVKDLFGKNLSNHFKTEELEMGKVDFETRCIELGAKLGRDKNRHAWVSKLKSIGSVFK